MNISLFQAAAAMNANAKWQEAISANMASAAIPGFKKQDLSFSAVQAGVMANAAKGEHWALPKGNLVTSFNQGELQYTGVPTEVALEGKGFFEVEMPNGQHAFTRDGVFSLNAQGQLVTKQGYRVIGDGGTLQVDHNNPAKLTVNLNGEVSQGADRKGKLKLVDFNDPSLLKSIGSGLFLASDPKLQQKEPDNTTVRQGFVEASNANANLEMANLISVMRSFEANQKIIQLHDERMGKAISELGSPNAQ